MPSTLRKPLQELHIAWVWMIHIELGDETLSLPPTNWIVFIIPKRLHTLNPVKAIREKTLPKTSSRSNNRRTVSRPLGSPPLSWDANLCSPPLIEREWRKGLRLETSTWIALTTSSYTTLSYVNTTTVRFTSKTLHARRVGRPYSQNLWDLRVARFSKRC